MDLPSWARVGQKVVCVEDLRQAAINGERLPSVGQTYTVRSVIPFPDEGGYGLALVEIVNSPHRYVNGYRECTFYTDAFRPLIDQHTDIATHFAHHLDTKVTEKA